MNSLNLSTGLRVNGCGRRPKLHLIDVIPHYPDNEVACPFRSRRRTGRGVRAENHAGTPVYVHAKVCVDDVRASVGRGDRLRLRIPMMFATVVPAVTQVDAADKGHVELRSSRVTQHNQLLVMRTAGAARCPS